ncbi:mitochondrial cardiolipin hydrolase zuc isoform X2 [Megalopta genalis]
MRSVFIVGGIIIGSEFIWQLIRLCHYYLRQRAILEEENEEEVNQEKKKQEQKRENEEEVNQEEEENEEEVNQDEEEEYEEEENEEEVSQEEEDEDEGEEEEVEEEDCTQIMFFSQRCSQCRIHTRNYRCPEKACPVEYVRQLENYINAAKDSLYMCMYLMTVDMLSNAFINALRRGVHVRVIMDKSMAHNSRGQAIPFHRNGIEVRIQQTDALMHHKFVIVDERILITGSTNWTMSAFFGNYDNIMITNQVAFVKPFVKEFQNLWTELQYCGINIGEVIS